MDNNTKLDLSLGLILSTVTTVLLTLVFWDLAREKIGLVLLSIVLWLFLSLLFSGMFANIREDIDK